MNWITKKRRIKFSNKRNQIKVEKSKFGKFNLENDVISDAHRLRELSSANSAVLATFES
jgi:hypothetical protein